ncbi:hypothetical protein [Carboxylicivirga taeanensis]|uniref:hypothetical protein n=1 Tax=Carboxylicivirga taeanensis TaxID=1416875 RepID=UPI003F6E171F
MLLQSNEKQKQQSSGITRALVISLLLITNLIVIYLYYYVLVFYSVESGKVYGESTYKDGQYEIYTLKYYYQHKGVSYFDKIDYVMGHDLELGDSLAVRVLRPHPPKHMVDKVYRDESKKFHYHSDDGFLIQYNEFINKLSDYEEVSSKCVRSPQGNTLHLSKETAEYDIGPIIEVIDNIRFNRGSLIDYFILDVNNDSIQLRATYHYLNNFSTDAMPSRIMHHQLKSLFPKKHIHVSVIDANRPKKEYIYDSSW